MIVWQWYYVNPNLKFPKIKIKEKEIKIIEKEKIVRVYCFKLWHSSLYL